LKQVRVYHESARRQYALVEWAATLGWTPDRILTVDEDQAKSGTVPFTRTGFGRLVTAVGRGEVGIVIGLEASRLARNSPDWAHLFYLCRWTDTLIADEHGLYDLSLANDRMVVGLRGQVSELELDNTIHRMIEARWSKARRGELVTVPPAGYERDDTDRLVMAPDEAVAHAFHTVFQKFDELGSARQVMVWWRAQGLAFPVRRLKLRSHPVIWVPPTYRIILETLHHPIYAGAYVYGRRQTVREIDPDDPRRLRLRQKFRKAWPVLIKGHHPGYISFEHYLKNQERIRGNVMMAGQHPDPGGPAREGPALLQGLARCGHCGRRMTVSYGGRRSRQANRTMQYRCYATRRELAGPDCQLVGGKRIDQAVVEAFLDATRPAGIEAAQRAAAETERQHEASSRYWELQIERARYEAERAERQFHAVEPENRLVGREVERRWNARLADLEAVRAKAQAAREEPVAFTEPEREQAARLGENLEAVWNAPTTTHRDRKRLLRCVIEEVQLSTRAECFGVRIVWKGGAVTDREVRRIRSGKANATSEDTIELVRKLATEFDDAQIARILNRQGRRTGRGNPFTKARIHSLRGRHRIPACPRPEPKDPREGPFTADEAAAELGVNMHTVHRWLRDGLLAGRQATPGAPWRILLTEEVRRRLSGGDAPPDWVGLTEAARQLGLTKPRVAYLVKTGKLEAMRTTVGKRECWKIDVSSAPGGQIRGLFDPMHNDDSQEA
jgi:DNA invertase Pin-like site-specific DNA recombinase